MTNWTEERCADMPNTLEVIGVNLYIQRRNVEKTDDGYVCESRMISFDEYNLISAIADITDTIEERINSDKPVKISREDFDLLDVEQDVTYHIYEEDGSVTIRKGVNR